MIVAITGASGFIGGKLLARCIAEGHTVRVLTRRARAEFPPQVVAFRGDLTGILPAALVENADVLYHCAGSTNNPKSMRSVHVAGTANLIALAAGRIGRWVQLSSVGVYGPQREGRITEETPVNPLGVYEVTKARADALVQEAGARDAFSHCVLRPSIVFGAGMPNQSLMTLIAMVERGWFFFIGAPGASANYVHVDNVVRALRLCADHPAACGRTYNLSDHRSMEEFIACIATNLGKKAPRGRVGRGLAMSVAAAFGWMPGFPLTAARVRALSVRSRYPAERIMQELDYRHAISMEQGLQELVAAWKRTA